MNTCAMAVSSPKTVQETRPDVDVAGEGKMSPNQHAVDMELNKSAGDGDVGSRTGESDMEEKTFITNLYRFMEDRSTPIERIPHLGFKQINLWRIYKAVEKLGGYDSVTARRLWKNVYDELGGSPGSTSAATCTRRHYERLVLPFERQLRGEEEKPLPPAKPRKQYKKSPDGKGSRADSRRKRSQMEAEEKPEDGARRFEKGVCPHSVPWSPPADQPQSELCIPQLPHAAAKDKPAAAYPVSQPSGRLFPSVPSSAGEVISPLEKKKRLAQASLGLSKLCCSPEKGGGERPSVIHCAQSPGLPRSSRAHGSSEGSPVPRSSPSSSRSSSPCSVSSDDCQAILDSSAPASDLPPQPPTTYLGNFTSVSYSSGVCKPLGCYPNIKDGAAYHGHRRDFLQVGGPGGVKAQRPDLTYSPGCKGEDRHMAAPKPLQTSSSSCSSVGSKACWVPPMSSFTKVLPKSLQPVTFHTGYKLQSTLNLKRPSSEEMATGGKKLQLVPPLHQGELKEKLKTALPKPLPTQQSLFYPHASVPVPYLVPSYEKARPASGHQLKGLSLQPLLLPAHLSFPSTQPVYHHVTAGAAYSVPYEPVPRPCPYPLPMWQPQAFASLHPQYPNTKL